jgi:acetolactate synthase small subunit
VEGHSLEQIIAQLDKLISVIGIIEIVDGKPVRPSSDLTPDYQN